MGDGKRLQRQASAARDHLELVEQAGFAESRLAHRRHHLPAPADRSFERALHFLDLAVTADESREPAP